MKIPENLSDADAATQGIALITMVSSEYLHQQTQKEIVR
jgi:hypothetical protein